MRAVYSLEFLGNIHAGEVTLRVVVISELRIIRSRHCLPNLAYDRIEAKAPGIATKPAGQLAGM